jgi:hypothetical protein
MNTCWERIEERNRLARSREVCAGLRSELELHQSWEKKFEDNIEKEFDQIKPCKDVVDPSNMLFRGAFIGIVRGSSNLTHISFTI